MKIYHQLENDAKYKMMTEKLRLLYTDDDVGNYIKWIIASDTAREYWENKNLKS